jgi:hypothetical protein
MLPGQQLQQLNRREAGGGDEATACSRSHKVDTGCYIQLGPLTRRVRDDEGCCWVMSAARRQQGLDDPRFDSLSDDFVINTIAECYPVSDDEDSGGLCCAFDGMFGRHSIECIAHY